jgi:lysozyme family protein
VSQFDPALAYLLPHEGGFVDDAADPGGATNFGISLYWLKHSGDLTLADVNHDGRVDIADIARLTVREAGALYRKHWWDFYQLEHVENQAVASKLFDHAVNMGGIPAIRQLQSALLGIGEMVGCDGKLGPLTLAAINRSASAPLLGAFCACLTMFYQTLAATKPKLARFEKGWIRRAQDCPPAVAVA